MKAEDELTEQQLREEPLPPLEPETPTPETPEETPTEAAKLLRVTLRNGKQYTGATEREILAQVTADLEAVDEQTRTLRTTEARGKLAYQAEREPAGYDHQKWINLMYGGPNGERANPEEAWKYQTRYMLGMGDDEDPAEAIRNTYKRVDKWNDASEVAQFQRMNGKDKDHPLMLSDADAAVLLQTMHREKVELTARNMTGVYHELVSQGKLARPDTSAQYEDIDIKPTTSRGRGAPKATGGGTGGATGTVRTQKDFDSMSKEEFEKELKRLNLK